MPRAGLSVPGGEDFFVPRRGGAPLASGVATEWLCLASSRVETHIQCPQRWVGLAVRNRGLHNRGEHLPNRELAVDNWRRLGQQSTLIIRPCNLRPLRKRIDSIKHCPSQRQFRVGRNFYAFVFVFCLLICSSPDSGDIIPPHRQRWQAPFWPQSSVSSAALLGSDSSGAGVKSVGL